MIEPKPWTRLSTLICNDPSRRDMTAIIDEAGSLIARTSTLVKTLREDERIDAGSVIGTAAKFQTALLDLQARASKERKRALKVVCDQWLDEQDKP